MYNKRVSDLIAEMNLLASGQGFSMEFVEVTETNIVKIHLEGMAAATAQETIKAIVERMIKEHIPEISSVELV